MNVINLNSYFSLIGNVTSWSVPDTKTFPAALIKNFRIGEARSFYFWKVTEDEINEIFLKIISKNVKDVYEVSTRTLKAIQPEILVPLLITLNKCIHEGVFSSLLKKAKVSLLFKKGDRNNKENYRPISILPA